jgi:hypothetical protein
MQICATADGDEQFQVPSQAVQFRAEEAAMPENGH